MLLKVLGYAMVLGASLILYSAVTDIRYFAVGVLYLFGCMFLFYRGIDDSGSDDNA